MSMIETLWGLVPERSTGQQWMARELQLVNWGGYSGHHRVRLSSGATLFSGGSGSGKSTLMDSYIALIMPHTTPFNGASNGGVTGKPRGKDQRNILSYTRGKLDESRVDGEHKVQVLRGDGVDTWSAIAMTWVDQSGSTFTAVRAWYVPASARALENVTAVRGTCDSPYDLALLEDAALKRFDKRAVTQTGLLCFDTDRDYTARLHTALGIGAAGDGHKAVGLLGRIQAGQQITTVDALYKTMVLDEPATFAAAEGAVRQFDELSATHDRMVTAQQQVRALQPIREHRTEIDQAVDRLNHIDSLGQFSDSSSPAAIWAASRRLDLLRSCETELRRSQAHAQQETVDLGAAVTATKLEHDTARELLNDAGGERLTKAQQEVDRLTGRLETAEGARTRLEELALVVGCPVSNRADFDKLFAEAQAVLTHTSTRDEVRDQYADARTQEQAARAALAALKDEYRVAKTRKDAIPSELHEIRATLAEAAGLTPADLPFVGELIEVTTEFEAWRDAFNLALGGFAVEMLIDMARLRDFRTAINSVPLARRIRFRGVRTGMGDEVTFAERTLPARLDFRPTPFTGWLKDELAHRFEYVCVDSAEQLGLHPRALTVTGQTSDGARGAHGGQGVRNVLGFTSGRRLKALETDIAGAEDRLRHAHITLAQAKTDLDQFDDKRVAYNQITTLTWDDADVEAISGELDRWTAIVKEVTSENPEIGRLRQNVTDLEAKVTGLTERIGVAKDKARALRDQWERTTDAVDDAQRLLDSAEDGGAGLSPDDEDYLTSLIIGAPNPEDTPQRALERLELSLTRAASILKEDQLAANTTIGVRRKALRDIFETFKERWPNPGLGVDPETSFNDYERTLGDLENRRLYELQAEWRESLLRLSGADLTKLDADISTAVREIHDRIDPVNAILDDLDFSDADHKLHIVARDTNSPVRAQFRSDLRAVREIIARASTEDERERAYRRISKVIERIRPTAPEFHDLIDVRHHVRISAEKLTKTGEHVAVYDHIGEKSGGESQELVAFIVGAALRYQLGDAGAERPRYAPVFLDEALIKADAYFTGRAINAWRGLGFQLIISAPNDKHSGIEPHVDASYTVLKDTKGRSFTKLMVALPDELPRPEGVSLPGRMTT